MYIDVAAEICTVSTSQAPDSHVFASSCDGPRSSTYTIMHSGSYIRWLDAASASSYDAARHKGRHSACWSLSLSLSLYGKSSLEAGECNDELQVISFLE